MPELGTSLTDVLPGRVLDRCEAQRTRGAANSITSDSAFRHMARTWAGISVKGLGALKAHSPVPDLSRPARS